MAWDGTGVFNRLYSWVADAANGIKIRSDRMDAEFANYQTGLMNCMTLDGQTKPTANIPMNSHKLTGLAAGTANGDSVRFEQLFGAIVGRNMLRNGGFQIAQSVGGVGSIAPGPGTASRTADCWWVVRPTVSNYSVGLNTQTPVYSPGSILVQRWVSVVGECRRLFPQESNPFAEFVLFGLLFLWR
jgi:hypothetical protein